MVLLDLMLVSVLLLFGLINELTWNLLEYGIHDLSNIIIPEIDLINVNLGTCTQD